MDKPEDFIGKKIGKCVIERPLKMGGQGFSFIGFDAEIQKDRVIKVSRLPLQAASEDERIQIDNLRREGIILSRLRHPQIVDMVEQGEAFGYRYVIVDRINGFDFNRVIRLLKEKQKELDCEWSKLIHPETALAIVMSALEPLAYAHTVKIQIPGEGMVEGLAHRDISAGNLMLGSGHEYEGMIHLIDFGIAKTNFNQSMTVNTKIIGTIRYMSPMRLMKPKLGDKKFGYWENFKQTQHDVHSMGCFLYELLVGETHINFTDVQQSLAAICNPKTYMDLYARNKMFHKKLQEIFKRSIIFPGEKFSKDIQQYKTAGEMLEAVKDAYSNLAGNRDPQEIIKEFAKYVENPEKIVRTMNENTSMIIRYTPKTHGSKGRESRFSGFVWGGAVALVFLVALVLSLFFFPKSLSGNLKSFSTSFNLNNPPQILDSNKPIPSPVRRAKRKPKPAKQSDLMKMKVFFKEVQSLMRRKNDEEDRQAYKMLNEWIHNNPTEVDPAFWILKADLIQRKNPKSKQIPLLLEEIGSKPSQLMTQKWMESKIKALGVP